MTTDGLWSALGARRSRARAVGVGRRGVAVWNQKGTPVKVFVSLRRGCLAPIFGARFSADYGFIDAGQNRQKAKSFEFLAVKRWLGPNIR
jgi:hypothetical protein